MPALVDGGTSTCATLRSAQAMELERLVRRRMAGICKDLTEGAEPASDDRLCLEIEGALLQAIVEQHLLRVAVIVDEGRKAVPAIEWTRSGDIAAYTYVLRQEPCAMKVRIERRQAEETFEFWDAVAAGQGESASAQVRTAEEGAGGASSAAERPPGSPATHTQVAITAEPAEVDLGTREPGSLCDWAVLLRCDAAEALTVQSSELATPAHVRRAVLGAPGRYWILHGRAVAPAAGNVFAGVHRLIDSRGTEVGCVPLRCRGTSALRLGDQHLDCVPIGPGQWRGKLDYDLPGSAPGRAVTVEFRSERQTQATWETVQTGRESYRLLFSCSGQREGAGTKCYLSLQVQGEVATHSLAVMLR